MLLSESLTLHFNSHQFLLWSSKDGKDDWKLFFRKKDGEPTTVGA